MKYEFNEYLLAVEDKEGNIIIYDTVTYSIYLIKKNEKDIFFDFRSQIINNGCYNGNLNLVDAFINKNIVKEKGEQYTNILQERFSNVIANSKTLYLTLLPTEKCNFRCKYCYEKFQNGKMSDETIEKMCYLIDSLLPRYDMLHISWFGGEPLLALDVIRKISSKVINICKKYNKPYLSSMTTNGYLLNKETIKELISMHIVQFQVTLDGSRNVHNQQRCLINGDGTFDIILNNLLDIRDQIETKSIKIIVRVNVTQFIQSEDINELSQLFNSDKRFIINIQKVFGDKGISNKEFLDVYKECEKAPINELVADNTICYAMKQNTLMIRSNGTLGKCTVNFEDPKNCFGNIEDININDFTLDSIAYYTNPVLEGRCLNCCIYPICFGRRCPAQNLKSCTETIDKYRVLLKSYSQIAEVLSLKG